MEILSANHPVGGNVYGLEQWHGERFTATAGSDAHGQVAAGTYPTHFDHPVADVEDLAREIRRGRCRPLVKEIALAGAGARVTEVVVGTKGRNQERPRIIVRCYRPDAAGWLWAERTADLVRALAAAGFSSGRFRVPTGVVADRGRLTVIEEGVRGRTLHDRLVDAGPEEARAYLRLAALWLARLHALEPPVHSGGDFLADERRRLAGYASRFRYAGAERVALVR